MPLESPLHGLAEVAPILGVVQIVLEEARQHIYKAKFPNAMVSTSEENHCTIVSNDHKNMVTINIEGGDGKTRIQITSISGKPGSIPSTPETPTKSE